MANQIEVIKTLVQSLVNSKATSSTGEAALSSFLNRIGVKSYSRLKSKYASTITSYGSKYQNFLEEVCGVRRNNTDTGAITGSDAGGSRTKTAESIISESASAEDLISAEYKSFTKNGLKVNITYDSPSSGYSVGSAFNNSLDLYKEKEEIVVEHLYNWWIPEALDLIDDSLGVNFSDGKAKINTLNIKFDCTGQYYGTVPSPVSISVKNDAGYPSTMTMTINMNYLSNITEDDKDGNLAAYQPFGEYYDYSKYYDGRSDRKMDILITDALTELTLRANIPYFENLPNAIKTGLKYIVAGYDNTTTSDKVYAGVGNVDNSTSASYAFMRWIAKEYAEKLYNNDDDDGSGDDDDSGYGGDYGDDDDDDGYSGGGSGDDDDDDGGYGGGGDDDDDDDDGRGSDFGGDDDDDDGDSGDFGEDESLIDLREEEGAQYKELSGDGDSTLYFNDDGENTAIITTDAEGDKIINAGNGGDILTNRSEEANVTLNGGDGDDRITNRGYATIRGGEGDDTISLRGGSALIIYEEGDGEDVIIGYTENNTLKIGNSYTTSLEGDDVIITIGEGNIRLVEAAGQPLSIVNSKGQVETVVIDEAKYKFNAAGTAVTLNSDFKGKFDLGDFDSKVKTVAGGSAQNNIYIIGNSNANNINGGKGKDTISGGAGNDKLYGNAGNDWIEGGIGNDLISGGQGNDTLKADAGTDTLTGGAGNDVFIVGKGDGSNIITDYTVGQDKIKISSGSISASSVKGSDVVLKVGTGSITIKDGKGKKITVIDSSGNTTSKIYDGTDETTTLKLTNTSDSVAKAESKIRVIDASKRTKAVKITGNTLANSISGSSANDTIYGGGGTDSLLGNSGNDKLFGDAGNDTLVGGKGNDTLTGGAGNDLFVYANGDGSDVIADYSSGDKIRISGSKISSAKVSGSDVILNVGSGNIRIKSGKGKELSIYNNSSTLVNTVVGGSASSNGSGKNSSNSATLKLTDSDKSPTTLGLGVKTANASTRTLAIKIVGNDLANSIKGGKGADTLSGGKGSDTLTGGEGKDVFYYEYGDGNDVITDYTSKDKIKIKGSYSTLSSGDDVVIKVGSGKITVKDAIAEDLNISKMSSYEERWFADDDNFATNEVSSILKSDNLITGIYNLKDELQFNQSEDMTKLTYSDKK